LTPAPPTDGDAPPPSPREGGRLARNSALLAIGETLSLALGLLTALIVTDRLGATYGAFLDAQRSATLFVFALQFGLHPLLVRGVASRPSDAGPLAGTAFFLRVPLTLLFTALVLGMALAEGKSGAALALVLLFVAIEVLGVLCETFLALIEGVERMAAAAVVSAIRGFVTFLALLLVLALDLGATGIAGAYLTSRAVQLVVAGVLTRRALPGLALRFDRRRVRPMLREAVQFVAVSLCFYAVVSLDVKTLGWLSTEREQSWYGAALTLYDLVLALPVFAQRALLPAFSRLSVSEDPGPVAARVLLAFTGLLVPAAAGLALLAPEAVALYPSGEFGPAADGLRILALTTLPSGAAIALAAYLTGIGRIGTLVRGYLVAIPCQMLAMLALVPEHGAVGAAAGRLAAHGTFAVALVVASRANGLRLPVAAFLRQLAAAVPMIAVLAASGSLPLPVRIALGGALYLALLALLAPQGGPEREIARALRLALVQTVAERLPAAPLPVSTPAAGSSAGRKARRVLYVEANEDGTTGGSHRALHDLLTHLDRSRFAPVVLFYERNRYVDALRGEEVHLWDAARATERTIPQTGHLAQRLRAFAPAVARRVAFLVRERIALVHLNNSPGLGFDDWLPAARIAGVPCVAHVRGEFWVASHAIGRRMQRRFTRLVAVSDYMADFCRRQKVAPGRIVTIHDGIDAERLEASLRRTPAAVRAELGVGEGQLLLVMVGHLRQWKGQHLLIDALRRLGEPARGRFVGAFVGGEPAGEESYVAGLHETVERHGLALAVRFLGARNDAGDLVRAADVVVHASTSPEPFGLVVLEAMQLGRPVVAAGLGGPVEIVASDTGMLFDPLNPAALAACIERLAGDTALRAQLGAGGRERARHFAVSQTAALVQDLYEEVLGGRSRVEPVA
jgi:glycosyltransferase involved in cell wall biosynthesis/O-antigen/teichoic acid export membrane protein